MNHIETFSNTSTESNERAERLPHDLFDTTAVEMGRQALLSALEVTNAQIDELRSTHEQRMAALTDEVVNDTGSPQTKRNREIAYGFRAERKQNAEHAIAQLEAKRDGIETVFAEPIAVEVVFTPSRQEIPVLHHVASDVDHFNHAA